MITVYLVELILDSGESRFLKQGDILIHRGTMHDWKNHSETEPCLMVFFVLPAIIPEGAAAAPTTEMKETG